MARPKADIDARLVVKFSELGCPTREIADYFNCSSDTLERRFAAEMTKGRSNLQMKLRQWQLKSARGGNVVMQIWLGKQVLHQQDQQKIAHSTDEFKVTVEDYTKK